MDCQPAPFRLQEAVQTKCEQEGWGYRERGRHRGCENFPGTSRVGTKASGDRRQPHQPGAANGLAGASVSADRNGEIDSRGAKSQQSRCMDGPGGPRILIDEKERKYQPPEENRWRNPQAVFRRGQVTPHFRKALLPADQSDMSRPINRVKVSWQSVKPKRTPVVAASRLGPVPSRI